MPNEIASPLTNFKTEVWISAVLAGQLCSQENLTTGANYHMEETLSSLDRYETQYVVFDSVQELCFPKECAKISMLK
jgi:predicted ATP-dependent serine protease